MEELGMVWFLKKFKKIMKTIKDLEFQWVKNWEKSGWLQGFSEQEKIVVARKYENVASFLVQTNKYESSFIDEISGHMFKTMKQFFNKKEMFFDEMKMLNFMIENFDELKSNYKTNNVDAKEGRENEFCRQFVEHYNTLLSNNL